MRGFISVKGASVFNSYIEGKFAVTGSKERTQSFIYEAWVRDGP